MTNSHTIAVTPEGMLAACADQFYGIEKAVMDVESEAGVAFETLIFTSGLTLTDDLITGDEIVFKSGSMGWLMNADESQFAYAVRRA